MYNISADQIQNYFFRDDFDLLKIKTSFSIDQITKDVKEILESSSLKSKDQRQDYEGIGLQYEDENNPLYDAVDQISYIPEAGVRHQMRPSKFIVKKNIYGEKLSYIYKEFEPNKLFRGRILNAKPNIQMKPHSDGNFVFNCHVPVISNPQCRIHVEGRPYYLEPDGSLYVLNAKKMHFVENSSAIDRIHLIFTMNFFSFKNWPEETVNQFIIDNQLEKHRQRIYDYYGFQSPR